MPISAFNASIDTGISADRRNNGTLIDEPLREALFATTGDFTCEWGNPSAMGTMNGGEVVSNDF